MRTLTLALAFLAAWWTPPAAAQAPQPLTGIAKVALGSSHACALTQAGAVLCWGSNSNGQLGNGSTLERRTAGDVATLRSGVVDIVAGGAFTCALTNTGDVKCWGANNSGQLGDGTTTFQRTLPVQVIAGAIAITANNLSACAVMAGGQAKCWGANGTGQLGDNSTTQRNSPTDVSGLADAAAIDMGGSHACAVTTSGGAKCWGSNSSGTLGNGFTGQQLTPVDVSGLASGVVSVQAGGSHSCALRVDGTVACWGSAANSQIGDGIPGTGNRLTPVNVAGGLTFSKLRVGSNTTCAVTTAGAAVCWGSGALGVLGNGTVTNVNVPIAVTGLASGVTSIDTNGANTCAVSGVSGAVTCWGSNGSGQLGTNDFNRVTTAAPVSGGLAFQQVGAGAGHSCGLTTGGAVYCWGSGTSIGDGTQTIKPEPAAVTGLASGVTAISVGGAHTCALTTGGGVKCWGLVSGAGLGDGTSSTPRLTPVDVVGIASGATAVAAGGQHSCAIVGLAVKCWGANNFGQLGNNTTSPSNSPVDVVGLGGEFFSALMLGNNHTCAVAFTFEIWCWGQNANGQLGINSTTQSTVPVKLTFASPTVVERIFAGSSHTCAFTNTNSPYCWGVALGAGTGGTGNILTPVAAFGYGPGVVDGGAAGLDFTCMHGTDDTLRCTGRNQFGMLGNGTVTNSTTPVFVQGGPAVPEWAQVAAGNDHACAVTRSNTAWCWGRTENGQLGTGQLGYSVVPLAVVKFDTSPAPFAFTPQVDVAPNSQRVSNTVTITGIDPGTPVSSIGGSFVINCVGGTTNNATIDPGQTLCVVHPAAATLGTETTTRVFIGDVEAVFTSTTRAGWQVSTGRSGPGTGVITSDPAGIACGATCTALFAPGVQVTLTAANTSTTRHTGWTGAACAAAGAAPCTFTITADVTAVATYVSKTTQSISFAGLGPPRLITASPFTVSATASSGLAVEFASTTPTRCTVAGDQVTLLAAGDCTIRASQPGNDTFQPAPNVDRSFTIILPSFALQVNRAGAGSGSVFGPNISCGTSCSTTLVQGTTVILTAAASTGSTFAGWSGDASCPGTGNCTFVLGAATAVTATFTLNAVAQSIAFGSLPNRALNRPPFPVSATASSGLPVSFSSQTGATCSVSGNTVALLAEGTCTVRASQEGNTSFLSAFLDRSFTITPAQVTLNVVIDGDTLSGTVASNPAGISCAVDCGEGFAPGTSVTLTAQYAPYYYFTGWSGVACDGGVQASKTCTFTLAADATAIATFINPFRGLRGDFNNDDRADLVFQNVDGRVAVWTMDGTSVTGSGEIFPAGTAWQVAHIADLNGDGMADLVWQNPDGRITLYLMNGTTAATKQLLLPAGGGWTVTQAADLDGDGKADLIFQNADGSIAAYLMDGVTVRSGLTLLGPGTGWSVTKVGDFDADGRADLVWTHADGRVAIWLMDGLTAKATNQILNGGSGWTVTHTPDLNGDGKSDLVWQNVDGSIAVWLMDGATMTSGTGLLDAGTGWSVTRTGDFDGDGTADLFFLHADGRAAIYLMNGLVPTSTVQILNAGGGWSAKRVQDMNADGKADIVWQNVDGRVAVWLMNGTAMLSGSEIMGPGTGWSVSGVSP